MRKSPCAASFLSNKFKSGAQLFVRWFWQAEKAFVTQRTAPVSVYGDTGATRAGMQSPAAMVAAPNEGGGVTPLSVTVPGSTLQS